jgi:hypothetical protein
MYALLKPSPLAGANNESDGPVFYDYFLEQNQAIAKGSSSGYQLNFETLGVSSPPQSLNSG